MTNVSKCIVNHIRTMVFRHAFLPIVFCVLLGIVTGACEKREQQGCRLVNEYVVATTIGVPSAIEVVRLDRKRLVVLWSADKNSYFTLIDNQGVVLQPPIQIAIPRGKPGIPKTVWSKKEQLNLNAVAIDAVVQPGGDLVIAFLCEAAQNSRAVFLGSVSIAQNEINYIHKVGDAGRFSRTVSLMKLKNNIVVGWQNTTVSPQSIELSGFDARSGELRVQSRITGKRAVYGPTLQSNSDGGIVLWSDVVDKQVVLYSASISADLDLGEKFTVDNLELYDATADVVPLKNGFAAVYRDNRDGDKTEEFYFTALDSKGKPRQVGKRISRADGPRGPRIVAGQDGGFYSAAVRSYNNNYLVGVNRFDKRGTKKGGEFQVYADKCDFIRAVLETEENWAILVYAENANRGGRILAAKISCDASVRRQ